MNKTSRWDIERSAPIRCPDCGTPVAERLRDGSVVVQARHHGEKHRVVVSGPDMPLAFDNGASGVSDFPRTAGETASASPDS